MQSFNLAIYQPPLTATPEDWTGFPYVVRIVDRGSLTIKTADIGAMEMFAQSVVTSDPFTVGDALRAARSTMPGEGRSGVLPWRDKQL